MALTLSCCLLWSAVFSAENYFNVLQTKCHLNKLAKKRKESPQEQSGAMNLLDLTFWFGFCTGNVGFLNPWAAHTALVSCGGSRVRGTSSVLVYKAWNNRLHCPELWWGLYNTRHWSTVPTFKCNRTSNSTLQMIILASRCAKNRPFSLWQL